MYHYIELTLLPDQQVSSAEMMTRVMDVLHLSLVNVYHARGHNPLGLAFPEYRYEPQAQSPSKRSLGRKIRLYSQALEPLEALDLRTPLARFEDYVHVRGIKSVAAQGLSFVCFKRVQFQTSSERLARRRAQYTRESLVQAREHFVGFTPEQSDLPSVALHSHSNQHLFRLFIAKQPAAAPTEWQFNTYGLSDTVGVPDVRA